jgi:transcriptional regulator with XRE-family HTH domain
VEPEPSYIEVMNLVRKKRMQNGWSQDHLAEIADLPRLTVQRAESGRHVPSRETARKLAGALGVDAARIRTEAGLVGQISTVMKAILKERDPSAHDLERLPPSVRKVFVDYGAARRTLLEKQANLSKWSAEHTHSSNALVRTSTQFNEVFGVALSSPASGDEPEHLSRGVAEPS